MKKTMIAACLLGLLADRARAQAPAFGVDVDAAWSRATSASARTGGIFLSLTAKTTADRLLGAATPVADMAELHETINDHGVMKMQPVGALALAQGQSVALKPGGLHIMLMGLKHPLRQGETFAVTLRFEHAPPVTATVTVQGPGAAGPAMDHGAMHKP